MTLVHSEGAQVNLSGLQVRATSEIPKPSIEFDTDSTYGTYIKRITYDGMTMQLAPAVLCKAGLWNTATSTAVELTAASSFSVTTSEAAGTGIVTITITPVNFSGITWTITATPIAEGYQFGMVTNNTNATYAIEWFECPRLGCQAHSGTATNAHIAHGFCGGMVITNPHLKSITGFGIAMSSPPNMQFWDYYDTSTKIHLYQSTDDEDGYQKECHIIGDGVSVTVMGHRHYYPNPRRAGNELVVNVMPYTTTYHVNVELFRGRTADGRCGYYDSALRYRGWGTNSARFWMADGPWAASANVSSRVKDSDFYYCRLLHEPTVGGTPHTTYVEDARRVASFIGATHSLMLLYGWGANLDFADDFQPPAHTPLHEGADLNTALGNAAAANIHLSVYMIPQWWDNGLTGAGASPWRFDDFVASSDYNSINQYVLRKTDDTPQTNLEVNQGVLFDPS